MMENTVGEGVTTTEQWVAKGRLVLVGPGPKMSSWVPFLGTSLTCFAVGGGGGVRHWLVSKTNKQKPQLSQNANPSG